MARVPAKYQTEPGATRCGDTFREGLKITGELYGKGGFGSDHVKWMPRITPIPGGDWASQNTEEERNIIVRIGEAATQLEEDLDRLWDELNPGQRQSIANLLWLAHDNLETVQDLYAEWEDDEWPLTESDRIELHHAECTGKSGEWVELIGYDFNTGKYGPIGNYYCPTQETRDQRRQDRIDIESLIVDAAKAIRCAQWGFWKMVLHGRAVEDWDKKYGGPIGGFVQATESPPGPEFKWDPVPDPNPDPAVVFPVFPDDEDEDEEEPDDGLGGEGPPELDPDRLPPDEFPPEDVPEPEPPPEPPPEPAPSAAVPLLIGGAVLGGLLLALR